MNTGVQKDLELGGATGRVVWAAGVILGMGPSVWDTSAFSIRPSPVLLRCPLPFSRM